MIVIIKIITFCLFSRAYSFQWKALYRNVMSHSSKPTKHGHMPKLAPQIHENTMPMKTNIRPETSISLKYFFMFLFLIFCIHADSDRTIV